MLDLGFVETGSCIGGRKRVEASLIKTSIAEALMKSTVSQYH